MYKVTEEDAEEVRCGNCNRLLAKGIALALTIKCPRCGAFNTVRAPSPVRESHRAPGKEPFHDQPTII